jgi:hypothetical protein
VANGFDILRLGQGERDEASATLLGHLPDRPANMAEDRDGNVWIGTASRGAMLMPRGPGAGAEPLRLTVPGGEFDKGSVGVARVGAYVAVFTKDGARLFAGPQSPPVALDAAPRTAAIAISNADESGSLWVAFESPFQDGIRTPVIGRLSFAPNGHCIWTPYAVPGLSELRELRFFGGRVRPARVRPVPDLAVGRKQRLVRADQQQPPRPGRPPGRALPLLGARRQ